MDDLQWVTQNTVPELSYRRHKNLEKNLWKSVSDVIPCPPGMTFEQRERAIGMLTTGMSARDAARHLQGHGSTVSWLLNRFQQNGNIADRHRSGRKTMLREDHFLMISYRCNRFYSNWKLGRLVRNATGMLAFFWHYGIIEPVVVPYLQQHNFWIFQHDNARPHTARHTQNILRIHNVNMLQWPARSLDPSPIKHLRDHASCQVRERNEVYNISDLELALQAEWLRIPLQVIRKLICSMRRRWWAH